MEPFRFEYDPGVIRAGEGVVADLGAELARHGAERALVVTGRTVGEQPAVMDPVRGGLGDHLADVFAATTPAKTLDTSRDAARAMREADADALVALGGGSSLDVAGVASVVAASDRSYAALRAEAERTGSLTVPDGSLPPVFAVPTTLAGADLSTAAGFTVDGAAGSVSDPRLMPTAACYDPELFATTPSGVLRASAMNGFDKGVETIYAAAATPVTDATATRGLERLRDSLPTLARPDPTEWDLESVIEGTVLVQYGVARPDASTLSVIHAFGHGLRGVAGVHQGRAHAAVAPEALAHLFGHVDARRDELADALGVPDGEDPADGVVAAVADVRDALELPGRLRALDGLDESMLDDVAAAVASDRLLANAPAGYRLDPADARAVLDSAW
ncbi:MAG: iron-containing alcohol dehydrogenase family protein [Halobacteriaceae archaeon]